MVLPSASTSLAHLREVRLASSGRMTSKRGAVSMCADNNGHADQQRPAPPREEHRANLKRRGQDEDRTRRRRHRERATRRRLLSRTMSDKQKISHK